ncbi:MAG: hypothetical protein KDA21_09925, partial [Phycisphaerales bacterium]|nr:hypothetical protein [Phycisphaerales bacterium]
MPWAVAMGATAWLLLALFKDRSRGRLRCPRCWYDMRDCGSLMCPECGHDARREPRLRRTRRRRKQAVVALMLLLGAYPLHYGILAHRIGWIRALPDVVLVR